jgi:hypothetical protein
VAHKHFWQSRPFFISVIAGAVIVVVLAIIMLESDTPVQMYAGLPDEESFDGPSFERDGKWYGLCDKNSIRSIEDFRQTVMNDPVLRVHYADFRWEEAVMKTRKTDTLMSISEKTTSYSEKPRQLNCLPAMSISPTEKPR